MDNVTLLLHSIFTIFDYQDNELVYLLSLQKLQLFFNPILVFAWKSLRLSFL